MSARLDATQLANHLRAFAAERHWEPFHTPKNLAMALAVEVGELLEHFMWLTPDESLSAMLDAQKVEAIGQELADVQIYLVRLADVLGIELGQAVEDKLALNSRRFPPSPKALG